MGAFLANNGQAGNIGWFYAMQGIVSIFMPALVGICADRWIPAQKMLSLCHIIAGAFMLATGYYAMTHTGAIEFSTIFSCTVCR